jgi:hypothetical protein
MADEILIEPGNPYDFDRTDLEELAEAVSSETGLPVETALRDEVGYGVSATEVLHVWLPDLDVVLNATLMSSSLASWLRDRWRSEREAHPEAPVRRRYVDLLGPDGKVLKAIEVTEPEGDIVAVTENLPEGLRRRPRSNDAPSPTNRGDGGPAEN